VHQLLYQVHQLTSQQLITHSTRRRAGRLLLLLLLLLCCRCSLGPAAAAI